MNTRYGPLIGIFGLLLMVSLLASRPLSAGECGPLQTKIFTATGAIAGHPTVEVDLPAGYKIIGGGARANWTGRGNLLTASYPENLRKWVATSKDHVVADASSITGWAVGLYDPNDEWDVVHVSATGPIAAHPSAIASLPDGYFLTGGGALVNWNGAGNLLTASFPVDTKTWEARSKDHEISSPASITAYVIGMKARQCTGAKPSEIFSSVSASLPHPSSTVSIPGDFVLTGGGAKDDWVGVGNLLTASFPSTDTTWEVRGKDHDIPSPASITAYAIGIRKAAPARGRYRVVINGFSVNAATWDHILEVDGKGDEVYISWSNVAMDKNGNKLGDFTDQTAVMGDTNGWPNRIKAGSRSVKGGITAGDTFPEGGTPWLLDDNLVQPNRNFPPIKIWEGDLIKGENSVVLTPIIWEWDGGKDAFSDWVNWARNMFDQVRPKAETLAQGNATANEIIQGVDIGLTIAVSMDKAKILGQASDRPIGMQLKNNDPSLTEFSPLALTLNYDQAEFLLTTEPTGRGLGVVSMTFTDDPAFHGNYTLYLQVQKVGP